MSVASLVIVLALFLPWFSIPGIGTSLSWTGLTAHGYLALALLTGLGLPGYLLLSGGWEVPPVRLRVPHAQLLRTGTCVQLVLILGGFLARPTASNWDAGALLALAAALAACAVMLAPVLRAWQLPH